MKLETYLDAYAKAYHEFEDDKCWKPFKRLRQRNKFEQQVLKSEHSKSYTNGYIAALKNSLHEHRDPGWERRTLMIIRDFDAPFGEQDD